MPQDDHLPRRIGRAEDASVGFGVSQGPPVCNHRDLTLCVGKGRTAPKPSDNRVVTIPTLVRYTGWRKQRRPEFGELSELQAHEVSLRDADDGVLAPVENERLTQDRGIAGECAPPQ
jgi:hypothetical protein